MGSALFVPCSLFIVLIQLVSSSSLQCYHCEHSNDEHSNCTSTCDGAHSCIIWTNGNILKQFCSSTKAINKCEKTTTVTQCSCSDSLCNIPSIFDYFSSQTTKEISCISYQNGTYLTSESVENCKGTECIYARTVIGPRHRQLSQMCSISPSIDDVTSSDRYLSLSFVGCVAIVHIGYHTDGLYPKNTVLCRCNEKQCNSAPLVQSLPVYTVSSEGNCAMTTFECSVKGDSNTCSLPLTFSSNNCYGPMCYIMEINNGNNGMKYELGCLYTNTTQLIEKDKLQWRSGRRVGFCSNKPQNEESLEGKYTNDTRLYCNDRMYIDMIFGDMSSFSTRFSSVKDLSPSLRYQFNTQNGIPNKHTIDYTIHNTDDYDYYLELYTDIYDHPPFKQNNTLNKPNKNTKPSKKVSNIQLPCVFHNDDCSPYYIDALVDSSHKQTLLFFSFLSVLHYIFTLTPFI